MAKYVFNPFILRVLSYFGGLHFFFALYGWRMMLQISLRDEQNHPGHAEWMRLIPALFAAVLFLSFIAVLIFAKRNPKFSATVLGMTLVLSAILGWVEISGKHYQIQTMSTDGCRYFYCNWWWYHG